MKIFALPANLILVLVSIMALMAPRSLFAESSSNAKVLDIKGDVMFLRTGSLAWSKLEPTIILNEGDSIKTGANSEVRLELNGVNKTAEITIRQETEFKFDTFRHDDESVENTLLNVGVGGVLVKAEKLIGASKFEVKTPTSIVGIRGTTFEVNVPKPQQ